MPTRFTLRDFMAAGRARLHLEDATGGQGLEHEVTEPVMYRPSFALTGFFEDFAATRLQVLGNAERAYLASLAPDVRRARLAALFAQQVYCVILANGIRPDEDLLAAASAVGASVLVSALPTRELFHQGTFVLEKLRAPRTRFYGTTVEVAGLGVMIRGKPGLGKSETALGLVKRGNALVADDLTCLRLDVASNVLYASASDSTRNYMEIRGLGIIHVPSIFGVTSVLAEKPLGLVVSLIPMQEAEGDLDRAGEERRTTEILGVAVPEIVIPVSAGRDLVNLVETAAQQHKLRLAGHDAMRDLDARLRARAVSGN